MEATFLNKKIPEKINQEQELQPPFFLVNGKTYAEHNFESAAGRRLNKTEYFTSNECTGCIKAGGNWCTKGQNFASGTCCTGADYNKCGKQGSLSCSDTYTIKEQRYMLCPNESGC
jgi:hypothetical protein